MTFASGLTLRTVEDKGKGGRAARYEPATNRYGRGQFLGQAGEPRRVHAYDGELGAAVARAQEGDEAAFAVAYRLVQPGLLGYLRGLVGDDAEDVVSDAWLEIARDLGRFRGDGAGFRGWTATIARHRALDHLRRQKVRPRSSALEQDVLELPGPHSTHDEALESISTEHALELVRRLPRDQAEAVLLRVVVGLDAPTAARVLDKRPGAVRTAAYRGLKRLAKQLGVEGVTDDGPRTLGESK
ncbi:RNA polymerase sigma24 factor [Streptomyces spinoverrucosus]|uniref:RNA polymerase sigma24 factor n=1 Tax=Streptomyces spinoverrucosus TaxID=284043 RepID=A0A4Y3VQA4_9ACTN|nr:RNA polymerase sigma24 factor [Streptomyces spinoverrucosus]GHB86154.1 RNA polymerase sigma24 factor [Streptomyces spinoverrucosus]